MTHEMVHVAWYEHDCAWITKHCDENHRRYANVPTSYLRDPAEHDRQVAEKALLDEAKALEGYALNHYSGATMFDQVLRLIRRDALGISNVVETGDEHVR